MSSVTDVITALSSLVAAGGIGFLAYQVYLAKESFNNERKALKQTAKGIKTAIRSLEADHERSRKENAVMLVKEWATKLDRRGSIARKFVESLSHPQCEALANEEPFTINATQIRLAEGCLHGTPGIEVEETELETLELSHAQSAHIRWLIASYLNLLESIFLAANKKIADPKIIKQQFAYLVNPRKNHYLLEEYRKVVDGNDTYPAITWMAKKLRDKHKSNENKEDDIIA